MTRLARNLIVDAILSILVVVSGFAFVNHASANSRMETLRKSGVVAMTAEELIQHVRQENLKVYWFGPISGDVYSIICTDRAEIILSYLPSGSVIHDSFASSVILETRSDISGHGSVLHSNAITDPDDFNVLRGDNRIADPRARLFNEIEFSKTQQTVEIHYPTLDASWDPRMDPSQLQLIQ